MLAMAAPATVSIKRRNSFSEVGTPAAAAMSRNEAIQAHNKTVVAVAANTANTATALFKKLRPAG